MTETIGFPCATLYAIAIAISISLMRVSRFSEAVRAAAKHTYPHILCIRSTHRGAACARVLFTSRIVATRLTRLHLHAPRGDEARRKTRFTVTYGAPLHAIRGLSRRGFSCSRTNSYVNLESLARGEFAANCCITLVQLRRARKPTLRLPSFCKTKALISRPSRPTREARI